MLELRSTLAAVKIQKFIRALKVKRAYQDFVKKVIFIQQWIRKMFQQENVFDVVERIRQAPIIQKYIRGYLAREKIAVSLHKYRMTRQLKEQEAIFSPQRHHIMESMQVSLAYLFRKRKARRLKQQRLAEIRRVEEKE